jgi:peptidoglycan/LPS O-acetylase OafA/YrhL
VTEFVGALDLAETANSLGVAFDPRVNSIGAIRLICATLVVCGHAISFGGYGGDTLMDLTRGQVSLARASVDVFFALSGFLLAGSCERSTLLDFARNRFLRIFPGFWVCLAVTALIVPPLVYGLAPGWDYVRLQASLFWPIGAPASVPGLFADNHFNWINGALWTLRWEVWCYASLPIAMWVISRFKWAALLILVALWAMFAMAIVNPGASPAVGSPFRLFSAFYAGVTAYTFRDRIPLRASLAAVLVGVLALATTLGALYFPVPMGAFYFVSPVALTYVVLYLAVRLPLTKLNTKTDLSYGIYIYGSFLLQVAVSFGVEAPNVSYWNLISLVMAVTLVFAWLSWILVEKPAMTLKSRPSLRDPDRDVLQSVSI